MTDPVVRRITYSTVALFLIIMWDIISHVIYSLVTGKIWPWIF